MFDSKPPTNAYAIKSPLDRQAILERLHKVVQTNKDSWIMTGKGFYGSISEDEFEIYRYNDDDYKPFRIGHHLRVMLHGRFEDQPDGILIMSDEFFYKPHARLFSTLNIVSFILCMIIIMFGLFLLIMGNRIHWANQERPDFINAILPLAFFFIFNIGLYKFKVAKLLKIFDSEAKRTRTRLLETIQGKIIKVPNDTPIVSADSRE